MSLIIDAQGSTDYFSHNSVVKIYGICITKKGESSWSKLDSNVARADTYDCQTNLPNLANYLVFPTHVAHALLMHRCRLIIIIQILWFLKFT